MNPDDDLTTVYMTGFHKRDDEVAELKAEIERLRELLREGIGDIWIRNADGSFTCLYEAIAAWHKRVREALGDAP